MRRLHATVLSTLLLALTPALAHAQLSTNTPAPDIPNASVSHAPVLVPEVVKTFLPAKRLDARGLEGWQMVGPGQWRVQNGEYVGQATGGRTSWLMLGESHQNFELSTSFQCPAGCKTGVLVRAEKKGDTVEGILLSIADGEFGAFRVTLDATGQETSRQPYTAPPTAPSGRAVQPKAPGEVNYSSVALGAPRMPLAIRRDGWNYLEVHVNGLTVRGTLNGHAFGISSTTNTPEGVFTGLGYGPLALRVSGDAEVRFRDVGITDLAIKSAEGTEHTSPGFRKQQLESMFYSESVTAADMDRDGNMDVVAGPWVYFGPDFARREEIFAPQMWAAMSYPDPLQSDVWDATGDGYPDVLQVADLAAPLALLVNPGKEPRRWERFNVLPSVDNEVSFLDDIDGDGRPEYIFGDEGFVEYAKPDPTGGTRPWISHRVSERGPWGAVTAHGLGTGDLNGDGRKDIIAAYGWWEQPATLTDAAWTYHPEAFGRWGEQQGGGGGARAYVYDVNGDGRNDVVTSLEAHGFGLAWFENRRDATGKISFERHMIMDDKAAPNAGVSFAALHALAVADIDGDGLLDIVTGKRWWGHFGDFPNDPDPFGKPVVYWFRLVREGGQAHFVPELINDNSAVGTQIVAVDMNKDGAPDVLTATRRGTFVFFNTRKKASR
jgi:hypothetical protein